MKNYYYLECIMYRPWYAENIGIGMYTSLKEAVRAANVQIHAMTAKTMGRDYYRIVRHDGKIMRKYGYDQNGKRYKRDLSKYPIYRVAGD